VTEFTALGPGGEFDQIRELVAVLGDAARGIGDDAAVLPAGEGHLVVSTDVSVERVHFRRDWLRTDEIGWRAASAALSDLAAMGASPTGLVVAVTRSASDADYALRCMEGVADAARSAGCPVVGGDLSGGDQLSLAVTVFGHTGRPVERRGAKPGDRLWLTGTLGGARAALLRWQAGATPSPAARLAFAHPVPRLTAGRWLAAQGARAMLDLSDGLAGDAPHLAAASGVHLDIDLARLPIHPSVHRAAAGQGEPAAAFAAVGGEDYELLVAMPPEWDRGHDAEAWTGTPLVAIGTVHAGQGTTFRLDGRDLTLAGFRHE
jgi:thiamine-monophosphate kinase